jgi:hypothetical protein
MESWIKVGNGRIFVVEDRHPVREDTVGLAKRTRERARLGGDG